VVGSTAKARVGKRVEVESNTAKPPTANPIGVFTFRDKR